MIAMNCSAAAEGKASMRPCAPSLSTYMSSSATSEQNMVDYLLSCSSLEIEGEQPQMEVYFPLLSSALKA